MFAPHFLRQNLCYHFDNSNKNQQIFIAFKEIESNPTTTLDQSEHGSGNDDRDDPCMRFIPRLATYLRAKTSTPRIRLMMDTSLRSLPLK
ncbi:hypothetical protein M5D96_007758 [Drosophila gunungcola]|uniref:Uncharacterized protein n=1 Tax=Drosophila gunungcola TaxID=103775 RepID=A0A9P9YLQ6_9MUSC|nr:hypothetical protein M5D96_007758 [Drosophila gunungcola]